MLRREEGFALALILIVGTALIMLASVTVMRGVSQQGHMATDGRWDGSLDAAEAGLDVGIQRLEVDDAFTTGDDPPAFATAAEERAWVIEAALARPQSEVIVTPTGDAVIVKPPGVSILYAVGFAPSRDADPRSVRAVRIGYDLIEVEWEIEHALLVGGDLELNGETTINDINDNDGAGVHVNGDVVASGSYSVEGCLTSSESSLDGSVNCPPSPTHEEPIPSIDPLVMYPYAHYALCGGTAYGGPAHASAPDPDLVPCNGNEVPVAITNWSAAESGGVWTWTTDKSEASEGVFYIHHGDFGGKVGKADNEPLQVTVILSSQSEGTCGAPPSGTMSLDGNSNFEVHPSLSGAGYDVAIVAQGDVDFAGGATVGGAILAHEQIDYHGSADSWGAVVAADVCHTIGSPVLSNLTTGGSVINYPGPIQTPFTSSELQAEITSWHEI